MRRFQLAVSAATTPPPPQPLSTPLLLTPPTTPPPPKTARAAAAKMQPSDCCARPPTPPSPRPSSSALTELNQRQIDRLRTVLNEDVEIHGRDNFPTLRISLHRLIVNVRRKLHAAGLHLHHVKMNGGAASYVLAADEFAYSDLDLIFPIDLNDAHGDFDKVRVAVFDALAELMPHSSSSSLMCAEILRDAYVRKMIKVADGDRWSLFSLHNDFGRCIELKFVDKMRRQFEFSVDSFQITLDPLLETCNLDEVLLQPAGRRPKIVAESMFGDFGAALRHLNRRLIDTRSPEEIRGGGLLKYCHLLARGYTPTTNCRDLERYMCSRFFIDFPDVNTQEAKLHSYIDNHFGTEDDGKLEYLQILNRVVKESTICLMGHERRQTQFMIERLRHQLSYSAYCERDGDDAEAFAEHTPRRVLLYLPTNSNQWIRVA